MLVFNFAQMMRLLLSSEWAQATSSGLCGDPLVRPLLAMFVGYGFWDPDLRAWMQSLLGGAHLYRNEIDSFKEREPSSATEYLQREFVTVHGFMGSRAGTGW